MPATVEEKYKGRAGSDKTRSITYLVTGTDDDAVVITETLAEAPLIWSGLVRNGVNISQLSDDKWAASVEYGEPEATKPDVPEAGSVAFDFTYQASSEHVKQSIKTVNTYTAPKTYARDMGGAINVVADGGNFRVEGVDVPVPPTTHTWSYYPVNATVSTEYQNKVLALMGKVNSDPFKGAPAGSVRFVGCRGGVRSNEDWNIRFEFAYQANRTNIVAGEIAGIKKDGHDIMWALYSDRCNDEGFIVKAPGVVYVEQVIERKPFADLGLGS